MKKVFISFLTASVLLSCSDKNSGSDAYGNFEAKEIIISAETSGKILKLNIEEGNLLKKGDTVCLIDTTLLSLQKQQALAQITTVSSKAVNVLSQIDVFKEQKAKLLFEKNRITNLLKDGAATQKQLDDIESQISVINKQIKSVETQNSTVLNEANIYKKQIAQIEEQIKRSVIINPIDGTVLETYIEENEITATGKPLYKIADLKEIELRVYISGSQLADIKIGQEVDVLIDKGKDEYNTLKGNVIWISPNAEFTPKIIQTKEERVNLVYAVKVLVKNDGMLKIGMPGEINFIK